MKWNDLTMRERSDLMSLFLKAGVSSLSDMKSIYEEYQPLEGAASYKYPDGGELKPATITEKLGRKWDNLYWQKFRREPKDFSDEVTNIPDCAKWSNMQLRNMGYNIWGDAWTRSSQKVKKVYSGYDGLTKPSEYTYSGYKDYVLGAADSVQKNFNWKDLEEGDIVGMYFRGSPNYQKAFINGTNGEAQTHTGHVVYRKGKPYVAHNVHGDIKLNKAKRILGRKHPYGIVSIYRPYADGGFLQSNIGYKYSDGGDVYTIQPGDTLSGISQRFTGKASNYMSIAASNNIEDTDKIYAGQKIIIPHKFDKPLKRAEIPTDNKTVVIDNYSPNYDYIVENDKIYYSRKGNDYWVDISDNDTARKNLYNFIGNKYNYRGYEDDERSIGNRIRKGEFNYSSYRDSVNREVINYNKGLEVQQKKHIPFTESEYYMGNRPFPEFGYNKEEEHTVKETKPTVKSSTNKEGKVFTPFNIYEDNQYKVPIYSFPRISKTASTNTESKTNTESSIGDTIEDGFNHVREFLTLGKNYIVRQFQKRRNSDSQSSMERPVFLNEDSEYGIIPGSFTGDTLAVSNDKRRYILPESIDASEYTYGVRNRGDMSEIHSEAAPITAFKPFKEYGNQEKGYKTYIGIGKDGRIKVGDISNFEEGDMLSGTYSNKVYSFAKDKDGKFIWQSDGIHGNQSKNVPAVIIENEKTGKKEQRFPINILANKNDSEGTTYGNITGGRVLVKVGDELRLLSGSIKDIEQEFEAMKKRQNAEYGMFYTLDNGSYNRGLRTYDKTFTSGDLKKYDEQNSGDSGNFLYIKDKYQQFPSDTLLTPNIRTKESASYKSGHSDVNEDKGVVLHHTAFMEDSLEGVTKHFMDKNSEASAHVVIGYDGKRRVFASPDKVTFHAGSSYFNGRDNVNDFMVGIEFQGDTNKKPLTQEQINSAVEYLAPIIRENGISLENITTHQNVRDLYNKYRTQYNLGKKAPSKPDITFEEYQRVIEALKNKIYYKK